MSGVSSVLVVLEEILDLLTNEVSGCALSPAPCRVTLDPGANTVWDTCGDSGCGEGDGQLWANINTMTATPDPGGCQTITWTATVGVVRCAAPMGNDGSPPSPARVRADAVQQGLDADAIRNVINCCDTRSEALRDVAVVSWTALGPLGGCVGGQWSIRGALDVCC